jgi:lipoprotein-releasing system ATP-binding protein
MNNFSVRLENVHKKFLENSSFVHILKGINFSLYPGEIVGLVGESGVGKSTLLHLIGLLDSVTSGSILVGEREMNQLSEKDRSEFRGHHIGFVYQKHYLLSEFTVLENIMMPLLVQGIKESIAKVRAEEMLEKVFLSHRGQYSITKLSGGEQQRASVARALIKKPTILLADEPTGNLDHETGEQVFSLFLKLAKEQATTTLMVTHNLVLTQKMDRVLLLEDGYVKEKI